MEIRQKVEVIAVCDTCGQLRPLRLRFEGPDYRLHRVDVDRVLSVREVSYVGIEALIFLCRARLDLYLNIFNCLFAKSAHMRNSPFPAAF